MVPVGSRSNPGALGGEDTLYQESGTWYILTDGRDSWNESCCVSQSNELYRSSSFTGPYSEVGTLVNRTEAPWGTGDPHLNKINGTYHLWADSSSDHPDYRAALWTSDRLVGGTANWTRQGCRHPDSGR